MNLIKLAHLNSDKGRDVTACLTGEPGYYKKAVILLTDRYGAPREAVDAHLRRVTNWPVIKDCEGFERSEDVLQAAVFALDIPGYEQELLSVPLCTLLLRELRAREKR